MSLPQGWRSETVDDLAAGGLFVDGDWVESKDQDPQGDIRLTQLADVGIAQFRNRSERWMRTDQAERLRCTYLCPGDILIARMPDPLGRACMAPQAIGRAVTAVDVAILRIGRDDVEPRYVMWALNAPDAMRQVMAKQSGTTRKRISRRNLGTVRLPVPPLVDQRRIVQILEGHLSRLDQAAALLSAGTERMGSFRFAVHDQVLHSSGLVEGEAYEARGEASRVPVRDIATLISGPAFKSAMFVGPEEGIPLLRGDNIEPGRLRWERTRAWPESRLAGYEHLFVEDADIILAMDRPIISGGLKLALATPRDVPCLLVQRVARIRCGPVVLPEFVFLSLRSREFIRHLRLNEVGTQLPHITLKAIGDFRVPMLSLDEQAHVVRAATAVLDGVGHVHASTTHAQAAITALRRSLLAAAFSGRLTGNHSNNQELAHA